MNLIGDMPFVHAKGQTHATAPTDHYIGHEGVRKANESWTDILYHLHKVIVDLRHFTSED